MENEAQTSTKMAEPTIRKSIDAWERRRRLRYILVPTGILLLILGLALRHTVIGKILAVLGAIIVGMYRSSGSRCPVCGHYNYTLKGREYHCRLCGFDHYDI